MMTYYCNYVKNVFVVHQFGRK